MQVHHLQKTPQYVGTPGWLLLTHNEESKPIAMFVDKNDRVMSLPIVLDERLFSDSVFRVTQLKTGVFLVNDIRYLNGICVYEKLSYSQRHELVDNVLSAFHHTELTALLMEAPTDSLLHGWEHYDDEPGTLGVFLPARE